jgi:hypothetical protein
MCADNEEALVLGGGPNNLLREKRTDLPREVWMETIGIGRAGELRKRDKKKIGYGFSLPTKIEVLAGKGTTRV